MIVVCMIVKNEAETIRKTLESVIATLGDDLRQVLIHDTGSTDGTQDVASEMALVIDAPWKGYAESRNEVLAAAQDLTVPGDLILMLDAGTVLSGHVGDIEPGAIAFSVKVKLGSLEYWRPQLFRHGAGWHYEGALHEAVVPPAGAPPSAESGLVVDYCLKDDARPKRWEADLPILEQDYSPRGRFYYAQTLELTGRKPNAFFWYLHRGERADGWYEERAVAYIRAISLSPSVALARWCAGRALSVDPHRGEAWLELALYLASCAGPANEWREVQIAADEALMCAPKPGSLFVNTEREWKARELAARAAFYMGNKTLAKALWLNLLDDAPEYAHEQILRNVAFCDD